MQTCFGFKNNSNWSSRKFVFNVYRRLFAAAAMWERRTFLGIGPNRMRNRRRTRIVVVIRYLHRPSVTGSARTNLKHDFSGTSSTCAPSIGYDTFVYYYYFFHISRWRQYCRGIRRCLQAYYSIHTHARARRVFYEKSYAHTLEPSRNSIFFTYTM